MKQQFQPRPVSKNIRNNNPTKTARGSLYVNTEQAQQTFKKGKQEQQSKNYQKALQLYIRSTINDPNFYQSYCNMGSVYRLLGRYSQSRSSYVKAIQIKPQDAISHYNLANVLRILGNIQQSIKHYEYVISLKQQKNQAIPSLYLNSLINIGICYKNKQLYEKAIEYYQKATKIDNNDEVIIFNHAMIIMLIINKLDGDIFYEVRKQRAIKAEELFKKLLKINPKNQIVQIQLIKIQAILYRDNQRLNQNVIKLKAMLPSSQFKEEINQVLGYVLKILKEYQASATYYSKSFKNIKQKKQNQVVVSVNTYDNQINPTKNIQNNAELSEQQAMRLILDDKIEEVTSMLKLMKDDKLSKHVIEMAIQLHLSQIQGENHFNNAVDIYNKYFFKNNQELSYQQLSIQAHKIIGRLLSKQNKYKESIKHFQFISNKLNSQSQKSKLHSSLGNDYEALGDSKRALQEYKIALQAEPDSYQMIYNVGCCLSEAGQHQESLKYFNLFLDKIQTRHQINMATKALYKADCLVTMSSCCYNMPNQFEIYEKAFKAIKEMESQSESGDNIQFQGDKLLNFYLRWADLLQQKLAHIPNRRSQQYLCCKEDILYAYTNLLQNQMCPDRNAILNNCATIYYQEKLFMNCLSNLNQIIEINAQTYNSIALTYLHLGEHYMATQAIYKAYAEDPEDPIIKYNKQIFDWIYAVEHSELMHSKYPNKNENTMVYRWQYGLILLDVITKKINETQDGSTAQQIQSIIKNLLYRQNLLLNLQELQSTKLKIILNQIQKAQPEQSYFVQQSLLSLCISKSTNLRNDLQKIISSNKSSKDRSIIASQALLYLFMLTNQDKESTVRTLLQSYIHKKQPSILLNLDRRITIIQQKISKNFNIANLDNLILNLCTWQCQIQSNLVILIRIIQKHYYNYKHTKTLQLQHHFPRHNDYNQCSATLDRLIRIIYHQFKLNKNFTLKSKSIIQMKGELIHCVENSFDNQFNNHGQIKLELNQQFIPISLYGYFQNKNDCIAFIKQLKKQSTSKVEVDYLMKNSEEIVVVVSNLVKLNLRWSEEDPHQVSLVSVLTHPLNLYHQAIIELSQGLQMIMEANPKTKQAILTLQAFK